MKIVSQQSLLLHIYFTIFFFLTVCERLDKIEAMLVTLCEKVDSQATDVQAILDALIANTPA